MASNETQDFTSGNNFLKKGKKVRERKGSKLPDYREEYDIKKGKGKCFEKEKNRERKDSDPG